jgi:hypothetical protein
VDHHTTISGSRENPEFSRQFDQLLMTINSLFLKPPTSWRIGGLFSDEPDSSDKDSDMLSWNTELGPKAKKVIEFSYSVEWPKCKEIGGGL